MVLVIFDKMTSEEDSSHSALPIEKQCVHKVIGFSITIFNVSSKRNIGMPVLKLRIHLYLSHEKYSFSSWGT